MKNSIAICFYLLFLFTESRYLFYILQNLSRILTSELYFRPDAQAQINGYTAARYKKFDTKEDAEEFVKENALSKPVVDRREKASGDSQVGKTV